ncbi:hypothetical protein J1614_003374 [Plenodomus biglobosus]|nr:hypothetical protein J1614_003374 [Plenodomus biglobosus]
MATESLMNVAGRSSSHPFADLRSASHAHHRKYKNPRTISKCKARRCCAKYIPPRGKMRMHTKTDAYKHIASRSWDDDLLAQAEYEVDLRHLNDMVMSQRSWSLRLGGQLVEGDVGCVGAGRGELAGKDSPFDSMTLPE